LRLNGAPLLEIRDQLILGHASVEHFARAMTALAEVQTKTEATTRALSRQWQAYLNTLHKN
jgi:hypothetical protein